MTDCSRCGDCCENIWTLFSPEERNSPERNWAPGHELDIPFINENWVHTGPDASGRGHRYECLKFDKETRLCTAHDDRPGVCSGYPYYGREALNASSLPDRCSFQADVRTNLPIVSVT